MNDANKSLGDLFPAAGGSVSTVLWREGGEPPMVLHGKFGMHAVQRESNQVDAHLLSPTGADPKETGIGMALCWVALTKMVATFPDAPAHIRDWCSQITEEFERVARERARRPTILA